MEFFNKSQVVKIRSHLDKYIVADDDQQTVRQSRNSTSRKTRWSVEFVEGKSHVIRLKSCHGRYLTASDTPFLLGMTGKRVIQTIPCTKSSESSIEWEAIRDGFQVKIRSCHGGKFLRGNCGTPPWRNSITHDKPQRGGTKNWVLWGVEAVDDSEEFESGADYLSSMSSFSSIFSDDEPGSPMSVATPTKSARLRFSPSPMSGRLILGRQREEK